MNYKIEYTKIKDVKQKQATAGGHLQANPGGVIAVAREPVPVPFQGILSIKQTLGPKSRPDLARVELALRYAGLAREIAPNGFERLARRRGTRGLQNVLILALSQRIFSKFETSSILE